MNVILKTNQKQVTREDFNECVDRCADPLYRFMLKSTGDEQKARDLVQDAFERLWRNHREVEAGKGKSYLFTTAYRAMVDGYRRDGRERAVEPAPGHTAGHYSDLNEALHAAVSRLPKLQQDVILLRDYEGYSYKEIEGITGLNEGQVKVYIHRARSYLREYIGKMENIL